ncbi:MAG: membrane protein insertase YidC [Sphingobacteriales bacterium]|nr:membrane protein insertase YidC [Sphingobacteriales bacterium]
MNFDRNTIIGFVILALLFFGYFYYNNQEQLRFNKQTAREKFVKDSIAKTQRPPVDTVALKADSAKADTLKKLADAGTFKEAAIGTEQLVQAENDLMKITFSSKGGQVKKVELKRFRGTDSSLLKLAASDFDKISYPVLTGQNQTAQTADLYFSRIDSTKNTDGSKSYSFSLTSSDSSASSSIVHKFTVKPGEYMIDFDVAMTGADKLLTQGNLNLTWQYAAAQQESDIDFEKQNTQVGYVTDGEFDYHTISKTNDKSFKESVSWVGVRQRFFFSILVAKKNFAAGSSMDWTIPADSTRTLVQSTANLKVQLPVAPTANAGFSIYYGPSDYHILKKYDQKFEKLVNLGQGMYSFVRPLNRFVILPIFDFFKNLSAGSMGLAIALLTLFIRLLISPLTYTSYLSGAKMKALRPEIAKLKEKFGADQQAMSMEQMKLFREAGVNPLGGCIPALLQIPIFFALFSFFNSEVSLRGAEFLWAHDLAAYDAPIKFGVNIPLLGDHLSLFNVTAAATSFLISLYSMSMTPDQGNPMMKYLPYIFPVFLLFFFNKLPSALTWYYTVSNVVTLALQFVIQNYIIDHDKILARIDENRKKPKTKSKWQERMEQMQEQQKKMKEMQNKTKR